jgi:hypothetical protein
MAAKAEKSGLWTLLRVIMWGGAAALFSLPAIAMRLGADGVNWTASDFAIFGAMLLTACGACEICLLISRNIAYRGAAALAIGAGFLLTWINLAVGIIGDENAQANLVFVGVLLVGLVGASLARFQARGMARALMATAIAQGAAGAYAFYLGSPEGLMLSAFFAAIWITSSGLFAKAARDAPAAAA